MENNLKYIILQTKYRKLHQNRGKVFPSDWYNIKEYELKKQILTECLEKKCLISESEQYVEFRKLALK